MSNAIFPTLRGIAAERDTTPIFDNVVSRAASGRRYAMGKRFFPVWRFNLRMNFLRQRLGFTELNELQGFFLQRRGNLDSFLYRDREWNLVTTPQVFGIGDGAETDFPLVYNRGGFIDRVNYAPSPSLHADAGDWRGRYPLYDVARTNYSRYTQDAFAWKHYVNDMGFVSDVDVAPDNTTTASVLLPDTNDSDHFADAYSPLAGGPGHYTWSLFAKPYGHSYIRITVSTHAGSFAATFNLLDPASDHYVVATGTADGTVTAGVEEAPGGFVRIWVSGLISDTTGPLQGMQVLGPAGVVSFPGNNVDGILVWGWQLEKGAAPTRYIPAVTDSTVAVPADYSMVTNLARVNLTDPAAMGAVLDWSGDYLYRVAFARPDMTFKQFLKDLYSAGVELETVNLS